MLAWLPLAFAVWYFVAPVLLFPVVLLLRGLVNACLSDLVRSVEQSASLVTFVTTLRPAGVAPRGVLTVDVDLLLYAFGMPLYAALVLAARQRRWRRHLGMGYIVLLLCTLWGAYADFLTAYMQPQTPISEQTLLSCLLRKTS